jgi:hypothetical protein
MFRLRSILNAPAVLAAALLCSALAAQDLKVDVRPPTGDVSKSYLDMVEREFKSVITGTSIKRFRLFQERQIARSVGAIAAQSDRQFADRESRELRKANGADLWVESNLSLVDGFDLQIYCEVIDIVSNELVASGTRLARVSGGADSARIREKSRELMEDLLKQLNSNLAGGLKARREGPKDPLAGMDEEIRRMLMANTFIAKWNKLKQTAALEVDLSTVALEQDWQYGVQIYDVSGSVRFILDGAGAAIELEPFSVASADLVKSKIKAQVEPKVNGVIRELLSQLD